MIERKVTVKLSNTLEMKWQIAKSFVRLKICVRSDLDKAPNVVSRIALFAKGWPLSPCFYINSYG